MNKKIKVGIIGCGAIGSEIAIYIDKVLSSNFKVVGLCDMDCRRAEAPMA